MIRTEDIKIGSILEVTKGNLTKIADSEFVSKIDQLGYPDRIQIIKVVAITDGKCKIITPYASELTSACVDMVELAMYSELSSLDICKLHGNLSEETVNKLNRVRDMSQNVMIFNRITGEMQETYIKKNHDYGNAFSEMYDELGINYGYGKIREKVNRIKTLKDNEAQVANEPLEDALLDCANYCILTLMEYQKRKEHGTD